MHWVACSVAENAAPTISQFERWVQGTALAPLPPSVQVSINAVTGKVKYWELSYR